MLTVPPPPPALTVPVLVKVPFGSIVSVAPALMAWRVPALVRCLVPLGLW